MRGLAAAIGLSLLALSAPALAQRASVAAASAESVARGLEAQYRAALIRERRLADDRELRLIADAETRMRDARRVLSAASGDRATAQAALDAARAEYARLVEAVPLQEAAARIEVEAFRAELEGRLPEATPELIAAYQEFADGDRASAWGTLEPLLRARANARVAAARAVAAAEVRQLASLREIMRINGEAEAASVLALWDQAAELDPRHFWTHVERARLALAINDLTRAEAAALGALDSALTGRDRAVANNDLGDVVLRRNDFMNAHRHYTASLEIARGLQAADPLNADLARDVHVSLLKIGDVLVLRNELEPALAHYREGLDIARALHTADRANAIWVRDVNVSLVKVGDVLMLRNDREGALTHYREGLELVRALYVADRNTLLARDLSVSLTRIADVLDARNDEEAARYYREALGIARSLSAADPSNADSARDVAMGLHRTGFVAHLRGDNAAARRDWEEALSVVERLNAMNSGSTLYVHDIELTRAMLARLPAQ